MVLTGEPARFEHYAKALGRHYDVYAFRSGDPEMRRVACLFSDVTARKESEQQLQRLNESLEAQVSQRTAMLKLLHDVTRAANEARTVELALHLSL